MSAQPTPDAPFGTPAEARMLGLARHHVALKGYPTSDHRVAALVHALQPAVPVPRPVDNEQPRAPKARAVVAAPAPVVALVAAPEPVAAPVDPEPLPGAVQRLVADPVGRAVGALIADGLTNAQIVYRLNKPLWLVKRWTGRWFQASGQGDRVDVGPWIVRVGALRDTGADS